MKTSQSPKLILTSKERKALRGVKILLRDIALFDSEELSKVTGINKLRCQELVALSQFQSLGSVGPDMAVKFWRLGFKSLKDLARADPSKMYQDYSLLIRRHVDPCVEDVFRCAIAQVKYKNLPAHLKNWWEWTDQRGISSVVLKNR